MAVAAGACAKCGPYPRPCRHGHAHRRLPLPAAAPTQMIFSEGMRGCVGANPSTPCMRHMGRGLLRLDCPNNPEFWLEWDTRGGEVRGRVPTALYTRQEMHTRGFLQPFLVTHEGATTRITHGGCSAFWLEMPRPQQQP